MKSVRMKSTFLAAPVLFSALVAGVGWAQEPAPPPIGKTSFMKVDGTERFEAVMSRMAKEKAAIAERHGKHLAERYDLADRPRAGVAQSGGRAVQQGVRAKLAAGTTATTWEALAALSPAEVKKQGLWPAAFFPLPHPNHPEGGMVFPKFHIEDILAQADRDLNRFDLEFDLPDHFLPSFPPPIFLNTRPDLGDVSRGKLVTSANFFELFNGILNPKQLDGLRLLVTPFPQQQFNATDDRRSAKASLGVSCFDCHANGHTNAATHLVGDIRPQEFRHRIDTPSLRGVSIQRLFGSQRALKSIEDFTEFEQRAAYFDGDPVMATKKGMNPLDRGSQVHAMSEFQSLLAFPPAPKLDVFGRLDPRLASESERRGEEIFHGKGKCGVCHPAPYYTDNSMHDLRVERFFEPKTILGRFATADGPIKTFPLRGLKDSPPYLHDGRLLTIEDTVEFFNLVLGTALTEAEKSDLVSFLLCL